MIDQHVLFQQGSRLIYISGASGNGDAVDTYSSAAELDDYILFLRPPLIFTMGCIFSPHFKEYLLHCN